MWNWILATWMTATVVAPHKFYFSTTDLHVNTETRALEITVRTFTDDTERAITGDDGTPLRLGDEREVAEAPALLEAYLKEHLLILHERDTLELSFIGFEVEGYDITWSYLECALPEDLGALTVESSLFLELFDEQINAVDCDLGGAIQVTELHRDNRRHTFSP